MSLRLPVRGRVSLRLGPPRDPVRFETRSREPTRADLERGRVRQRIEDRLEARALGVGVEDLAEG